MAIVHVVYRNNGYEGMSKPLAVFDEAKLAEIFLAGAKAASGSLECIQLIMNDVDDKIIADA